MFSCHVCWKNQSEDPGQCLRQVYLRAKPEHSDAAPQDAEVLRFFQISMVWGVKIPMYWAVILQWLGGSDPELRVFHCTLPIYWGVKELLWVSQPSDDVEGYFLLFQAVRMGKPFWAFGRPKSLISSVEFGHKWHRYNPKGTFFTEHIDEVWWETLGFYR